MDDAIFSGNKIFVSPQSSSPTDCLQLQQKQCIALTGVTKVNTTNDEVNWHMHSNVMHVEVPNITSSLTVGTLSWEGENVRVTAEEECCKTVSFGHDRTSESMRPQYIIYKIWTSHSKSQHIWEGAHKVLPRAKDLKVFKLGKSQFSSGKGPLLVCPNSSGRL